eukprot:CAMPEP_0167826496 /NCGR_PEP_ID=MMETSP0112_2-20121227/10064_1 /TAXON_ID=91324 /ORGANISM="Lotharella globosa, Strain CCCM811" /LENGTH=365 /DNA_ID=CAMNT_0007728941 /DNA_START=331 /DNA_END=1425 /DNA_ORIENTATION=+
MALEKPPMRFAKTRSTDLASPNAETDTMVQSKKEGNLENHRKKMFQVKLKKQHARSKTPGPDPSSPKSMKFSFGRAESLTHRNADTEEVIQIKKSELQKKEKLLRKRVEQQRSGVSTGVPPLKFRKDDHEDFRTPNATTERDLRLRREQEEENQRKIMMKIDKLKNWKKGKVKEAPIGRRTSMICTKDPVERALVLNAETEEMIKAKRQHQEDEIRQKRNKVAAMRSELKERRESIAPESLTEEEQKILGGVSKRTAALACKYYAIKGKEKQEKRMLSAIQRRRSSLSVMKDRTESWMKVNGETDEMRRLKMNLMMEEERERNKRIEQQRKHRRSLMAAQQHHTPHHGGEALSLSLSGELEEHEI